MMTTIRFSAPELVEQDNARRDFRSDMWALGCTCAEVPSNGPLLSCHIDTYIFLFRSCQANNHIITSETFCVSLVL